MSDIDRRQFLRNSAFSAAGLMMGKNVFNPSNPAAPKAPSSYNIMEEVEKYRMIDSHAHVYFSEQSPDIQIAFADRLGIDKLVISRPIAREKDGTPEDFRLCNDLVLVCVKKYPGRFIGQMALNPKFKEESLEEIKRCVVQWMACLKVYSHVNIAVPSF